MDRTDWTDFLEQHRVPACTSVWLAGHIPRLPSPEPASCAGTTTMARSTFALFMLTTLALVKGRQQPSLVDFYEELGCQPRFENDSKSPTSFDCSTYEERDKSKCYFDGKSYNEGEDIAEDKAPVCEAACRCMNSGLGPYPSFNCANVECPDLFGPRLEPGCYRTYEHDKCCSIKTVCTEEKSPTTCEYNNATYNAGEKFYPEEEPCLTCICMEGFKGKLEAPFCQKVQCNAQLRYSSRLNDACVPVYYGNNGCCAIDWKCPESSDKVRAAATKDSVVTSETCKFGKLTLQPGESLEPSESSAVDCTCKLPPYLTCIQPARH